MHAGTAIAIREGGLVAPAIHDFDQMDLNSLMTWPSIDGDQIGSSRDGSITKILLKIALHFLETDMQTQLKIDFHGASPSEALQSKIADYVGELERMYGRLTACHVSLEPPGHHQRKGGLFHVVIHLSLPDGREVSVGTTPPRDKRHANVLFAIGDAFRRARRQLQDHARRMRGHVKTHGNQPVGKISRFDPNTGYGFIRSEDDGHEIYFHRNSVIGGSLARIRRGSRVFFVEEMGEKGPQASTVRRLGKHALR